MELRTRYNIVTKGYENIKFHRSDTPIAMVDVVTLILVNVNSMIAPDIVDHALLIGEMKGVQ
jgi:hypothetical protein